MAKKRVKPATKKQAKKGGVKAKGKTKAARTRTRSKPQRKPPQKKKPKKVAPKKPKAKAKASPAARKPARPQTPTRPSTAQRRPTAVPETPRRTHGPAAPRPPARRPGTGAPPAPEGATRTDPMRQLAQRIVDVTAAGDESATLALYASNVQSAEPGVPTTTGAEALRRKFANWNKLVSRATWRARNVWIGGNTIIIEWKANLTLADSGRSVDFGEIAIHEVEHGKIARERYYYDRSALQP